MLTFFSNALYIIRKIFRFIELIIFFPFIFLVDLWKHSLETWKKVGLSSIAVGVLLPIWIVFYLTLSFIAFQTVQYVLYQSGVIQDDILIAGTGSMYPTFPKGSGSNDIAQFHEIVAGRKMRTYPGGIRIWKWTILSYELQHGDIVSFSNDKTRNLSLEKFGQVAGFVKRVIGLPGDVIEIRDGFVYRNNELLKEQYTARARSTYGGTQFPDCRKATIGENQVFVLGDNRTASDDSRYEIGLINFSDIDHVLPFSEQDVFAYLWRDASSDEKLINQATLDASEYVSLLNQKRRSARLEELEFDNRLAVSAFKRGEIMLSTNDFSFEATQSGYTIENALLDAGYSNIVYGESVSTGYLTAEELLENSFEFADSRKFLLTEEYDDVGISAVVGDLNGCPAQVIVQHFGGWIPPEYTAEEISSWQELVDSLNTSIPSWEEAKSFEGFYKENKDSLDRLLVVLYRRREIANRIISRMNNQQWLTDEDKNMINEDEKIAEEANRLIENLNSQ